MKCAESNFILLPSSFILGIGSFRRAIPRAQSHKLLTLTLLFPATKLAAGGVDVPASALADVHVHSRAAQDFLKLHYVLSLRPFVRQRFHFVVSYQIDVGS